MKLVLVQFSISAKSAMLTPEEKQKCNDLNYISQVRDTYSCEISWSIDACQGVRVTSGAVLGMAAITPIEFGLKNRELELLFKDYMANIEKHHHLSVERNERLAKAYILKEMHRDLLAQ